MFGLKRAVAFLGLLMGSVESSVSGKMAATRYELLNSANNASSCPPTKWMGMTYTQHCLWDNSLEKVEAVSYDEESLLSVLNKVENEHQANEMGVAGMNITDIRFNISTFRREVMANITNTSTAIVSLSTNMTFLQALAADIGADVEENRGKIDILESTVDKIDLTLNYLDGEVRQLGSRLSELREKSNSESERRRQLILALREELNGKIDALRTELDKVTAETTRLVERVKESFAAQESRVGKIEGVVEGYAMRIAILEATVHKMGHIKVAADALKTTLPYITPALLLGLTTLVWFKGKQTVRNRVQSCCRRRRIDGPLTQNDKEPVKMAENLSKTDATDVVEAAAHR